MIIDARTNNRICHFLHTIYIFVTTQYITQNLNNLIKITPVSVLKNIWRILLAFLKFQEAFYF